MLRRGNISRFTQMLSTRFVMLALGAILAAGCAKQGISTPTPVNLPAAQHSPTASNQHASTPVANAGASKVTTGLTEDGHHFWGAPDAPVVMIDFSDFM